MENNPVSNKWARRILAMWDWQQNFRGDNVRQTAKSVYVGSGGTGSNAGPNTDWQPRQFRVKSEENDYLVCVPYDSQDEVAGEKEYKIAKPPSFRGGAERWGVYPPYVADSSVIWAAPVRRNGAEDGSENKIVLMDLNFDGRLAGGAVKLTQTGGSAGDESTQCSFTYTVSDMADNELATGVNPTADPNLCTRPAVGFRIAAKAGIATYGADGLVLIDFNEIDDLEACS